MKVQEYILNEVSLINTVVKEQLKLTPPYLRGNRTYGIATGSGDSLIAAEALELFTNYRIAAKDPYELRLNPPAYRGGFIIGISVKGRTREVIKALKTLKELGWLAIGLTSDLTSSLAKAADETIKLYYSGGEQPIGIGNFISEIAAAAALAGLKNYDGLKNAGIRGSLKSVLLGKDILLVGDREGYLSGEFISLKLSEIFCKPSRVFKIEQFLHAPIYSIKQSSSILFIGNSEKVLNTYKIFKELSNEVAYLRSDIKDVFNSILSYIYTILIELANEAGTQKLKEPCFKTRKFLLERTTPVIYS